MVKPALNEMISVLKSRNFLVHVIMSDREGAIGKMRVELMALGIEVDVSAADRYSSDEYAPTSTVDCHSLRMNYV